MPETTGATFILLDRSGSMNDNWNEMLGGLNGYARQLAAQEADTLITVAVFDTIGFDVVRQGVQPKDWCDLTAADASPRAGTPLYDCLVRIINMAEGTNRPRTSLVVITDGRERDSRHFSRHDATNAIAAFRKRGWDVIFLGAAFDNFSQASELGVQPSWAMPMARGHFGAGMAAMATRTAAYTKGTMRAEAPIDPAARQAAGGKPVP